MARVTKINVGGTNYDIAHEGELKNSGFEVVTELPKTGNFNGRQVFYDGRVYTYYKYRWNSPYDPVQIPAGYGIKGTTEDLTSYGGYVINDGGLLSQVPALLDKSLFISNNDNCVKKSDRLYELIDNETGTITVKSGIVNPVLGQTLRYTAINPIYGPTALYNILLQNGGIFKPYSVSITQNSRSNNKAIYKIEYYTFVNATGDSDVNNQDNYEWKAVFEKELPQVPVFLYPVQVLVYPPASANYIYIQNVRVSITPTVQNGTYGILINSIDVKYYGPDQQPLIYANRLINYDAVIEPTQTSETFKTTPWILQYLVQGVNWLRANDNTKLDKRAYNQIYTNRGYVNVTGSSQGALIIELPFAPNSDVNNSMTYIELNVYSHRKGCSKYIIGVYSYSQNSQYEWSVYSYMGYNYFSKISFGRRTDNNNIVVVLGDFTDLHKNEHFSISHIITGYNRNNDDTDGFLLYTDSNSNNYNTLISSTYISPIISYNDLTDKPTLFSGSYNDLTDKPTLATVATSGSYNDLTDKPTFSGSYNDLTDKPTLFSGSYDDLTNKPNLATVATSGSYNDLTDKPTIPSSLEDLGGSVTTAQITDGSITNAKLANSSMSLNGINCELGGTKTLPCFISIWGTLFQVRIENNWLQIYRNGIWANLYYLLSSPPTVCRYITDLSDPSWYDESITEYELDNSATTQLLLANSSTNIANWIKEINANQITFNSSVITSKDKGALDNIVSNLKGEGYSVFVDNDIDTILSSGNDWVISIKIKRFNDTYKAIIECYVAR